MSLGNGFGHATIEALLVLLHASASGSVLADGFDHACPAGLVVRGPTACLAMLAHVIALLTTFGIPVPIKVGLIQPHAANGSRRCCLHSWPLVLRQFEGHCALWFRALGPRSRFDLCEGVDVPSFAGGSSLQGPACLDALRRSDDVDIGPTIMSEEDTLLPPGSYCRLGR